MIEVEGLVKRFGQSEVVSAVSFVVPDGRITGLLGPNGAGKTTTLRMICSVLRPDAGSARVDGFDAAAEPRSAQARVGALPEAHGLYPRLTARENIRYYGHLRGMRGPVLEQRIERMVEVVDMAAIIDRRCEGFSHGETVKVALARALVHDPPNVVLDEPTVGLDVMSTRAVRALVRDLRDQGRAVLFSTHIMQEVSALCDEIVIIADGRLVAKGTPDALRQRTGKPDLEDAFVSIIGSSEGLR
jgi:sodium transport system ATP-binding protein